MKKLVEKYQDYIDAPTLGDMETETCTPARRAQEETKDGDIIEDFEFCVNGKLYSSCSRWRLFYRGTMCKKKPDGLGVAYFGLRSNPNVLRFLYCGEFSGNFPCGQGVLFEEPNSPQCRNRVRYFGGFAQGFFDDWCGKKNLLFNYAANGIMRVSRDHYRGGIQRDAEYDGVILEDVQKKTNVKVSPGNIRGIFNIEEGWIVSGRIWYTIELLSGNLVDLKKEGLEYVGELYNMTPYGQGTLNVKEENFVLYRGDFRCFR